jgi:hypothetical protein
MHHSSSLVFESLIEDSLAVSQSRSLSEIIWNSHCPLDPEAIPGEIGQGEI